MTVDVGGRPTKFTEENRQIIYDFIRRGATYALCARRIGINEKTFYDWLRQGREYRDIEDRELTEKEQGFVAFCNKVDELESEYLTGLIDDVSKNNKQWMLTRRMRGEFADEMNLNVNAKVETVHSWKDMVIAAEKEE